MSNNKITILFIGDIVGRAGRKAVAAIIPELKKELQPDFIIANAENLAHGVGVTKKTLDQCHEAGINLFTSGNHIWKKEEVNEIFQDPDAPLIRPANYDDTYPGQGYTSVVVGTQTLLVANLNGRVFMQEKFKDPFATIDQILTQHPKEQYAGIIVDFHAEATSEKIAFGWYVDGRVSAVIGTHTHIPTADEKILPGGTAYITDVGMVGPKSSVLGVSTDIIIHNFLHPESRQTHDIPTTGICLVNAVMVTINTETKKAETITRIYREIEV